MLPKREDGRLGRAREGRARENDSCLGRGCPESDAFGVWRRWFGGGRWGDSGARFRTESDDCRYKPYTRAGDFCLPNWNLASELIVQGWEMPCTGVS
jgi:hypothetical protein